MFSAKEIIIKYCSICFFAILAVWLLSSCGGSDNSPTWSPDISIDFPISGSSEIGFSPALVYGDSVDVRGTARDPNGAGIASLHISLADGSRFQGIIEPIDPNNLSLGVNWLVKNVPLDQVDENGNIRIEVHVRNQNNNWATTLKINESLRVRSVSHFSPVFITNDQTNNRLLIVDYNQSILIGTDTSTGKRSIISSNSVGEGPPLVKPASVAVNNSGTTAYLMDQSNGTLFRIDTANGNRTVVSDNTISEGPDLQNPYSIALVEASNLVIVVDLSIDGIYSIDLTSGERRILSNDTVGLGPNMTAPYGISYNSVLPNKVLVTNIRRDELAVFEVDLETGDRTVLSGLGEGQGANFNFPLHIHIDPHANTAYVTDAFNPYQFGEASTPALIAVDLETGDRQPISSLNKGKGFFWVRPSAITASDDSEGPIYVIEGYTGALMVIDRNSGDRRFLYDDNLGLGPRPFRISASESDGIYGEAFIPSTNEQAIFKVDLMTGNRDIVYQLNSSETSHYFRVEFMEHDTTNNRLIAYLAENTEANLVSIDLDTNQQTILSDEPTGKLCLDMTRQKAYTVNFEADKVLIEIDLNNGERTVVSSSRPPIGNGPEISNLGDCVVDENNGTLYLVNNNYSSGVDEIENWLYAIDLETGDRRVISSSIQGSGPSLNSPTSIALDLSNNVVLVTDELLDWKEGSVIAINLTTGNRTVISDQDTGNGPLLKIPSSIGIDQQKNIAYVGGFDSVYMINLGSCAEDKNADGYADEGCDRVVISQ